MKGNKNRKGEAIQGEPLRVTGVSELHSLHPVINHGIAARPVPLHHGGVNATYTQVPYGMTGEEFKVQDSATNMSQSIADGKYLFPNIGEQPRTISFPPVQDAQWHGTALLIDRITELSAENALLKKRVEELESLPLSQFGAGVCEDKDE